MQFQFIDLKKQYRPIGKRVDSAIMRVVRSGQYVLGRCVLELEERIAQFIGTRYSAGCASGTDALFLSLKALGIGPGDEVITTPFTFIATAEAIANCGATPVFVDIDPRTYGLDPAKITQAITKKTKAILPIHLYGQMANMEQIVHIAKRHSLYVIEDAAQAFGAKQRWSGGKWKMAGSIGVAGCFSFFPTKNFGAYGDGGMVITNSKRVHDIIKTLRTHGAKKKYVHDRLGLSSRLDEVQAAILIAKLPYVRTWNKRRASLAQKYIRSFSRISKISTPVILPGYVSVFNQFTVRTKQRDRLALYLHSVGIPYAIYYSKPLHLQKAFSYLGYVRGDFPEAELAAQEVLSLPLYPELTANTQKKIIKAVVDFFSHIQ